jgi:hypothetical protein
VKAYGKQLTLIELVLEAVLVLAVGAYLGRGQASTGDSLHQRSQGQGGDLARPSRCAFGCGYAQMFRVVQPKRERYNHFAAWRSRTRWLTLIRSWQWCKQIEDLKTQYDEKMAICEKLGLIRLQAKRSFKSTQTSTYQVRFKE